MQGTQAPLDAILSACLSADNNMRRDGETALRLRLSQPALALEELVSLLQNSPHPEIRQLCAVVLRRRIAALWKHNDPARQAQTKTALLNQLITDPQRSVRTSIAHVIVAVTRCCEGQQWNEMWDFLAHGAMQGVDEGMREVCALALRLLTADNVGEVVEKRLSLLLGVFVRGMDDQSVRVKVQALHGMSAIVEWLGDTEELKSVSQHIPKMIEIMSQCLQTQQEELVSGAFEMFEEMAASRVPVLVPHIALVVQFLIAVANGNTLEVSTRQQGVAALTALMNSRPKALVKRALVQPIMECGLGLCVLQEEEDLDENEVSPHKLGMQIVDAMCAHFASKHVLQPLLQFVNQSIQHSSAWQRRTGQVCIAVMCEGLHTKLHPHIPLLTTHILSGMRDSDALVRESAFLALSQCADYAGEHVVLHAEQILPAILGGLHDPNARVVEKACFALEGFVSHLGDAGQTHVLDAFLPQLVRMLMGILTPQNQSQAPQDSAVDVDLKEIAVSALSATVEAAGEKFVPYAQHSMVVLLHAMQLVEDEKLVIRARATNCVGTMAAALPKDQFVHYIPQVMEFAFGGLELEFTELREATYELFTKIAEVLGDAFEPYLPTTVSWLLASCRSNDGIFSVDATDADASLPAGVCSVLDDVAEDADGDGNGNENGDADSEEEGGSFAVRTAFLDEKVAACEAIGFIALHSCHAFSSFRAECVGTLTALSRYFHAEVRRAVISALQHILESSTRGRMMEPWSLAIEHTCDLDTATYLSCFARPPPVITGEESGIVGDVLGKLCVSSVGEDESVLVVAQALDSLTALFELLGAHMQAYATTTVQGLTMLLQKRAPCQDNVDEDDGEEGGTADEEMLDLFDAILGTVRALAKTFGPHAKQLIAPLVPELLGWAGEASSDEERAVGVGALCEVVHYLHGESAELWQPLLSIVFRGLGDAGLAADLRNSCTFGVGVVFAAMPATTAAPHLPTALQCLHQIFSNSTAESDRVLDNACGATARLILFQPNLVQPHLPQIFPVLLAHLPLRTDMDELVVVCRTVGSVYTSTPQLLLGHLNDTLRVVSGLLQATDETTATASANGDTKGVRSMLIGMVKHMAGNHTAAFQTALVQIAQEDRDTITVACASEE